MKKEFPAFAIHIIRIFQVGALECFAVLIIDSYELLKASCIETIRGDNNSKFTHNPDMVTISVTI